MADQSIHDRSYEFACRVIRLVDYIGRKSLVLRTVARQVLRSATSVGANLEEASAAQSKPDFISKCSIAAKEARETRYCLRLLIAARGVSHERLAPLIEESNQLIAILTAIIKKAGTSPNRGHSTSNIQH
ncbi:MAG TPA: four helix bundle protein [Thermoanaerobaculia bacterium]|nr:four helix bundle protein [Thermoanaerobaculia bacterium]